MSKVKGIIFSKNYSFAYKLREKCFNYGVEVDYISSLKELVDFVLDNSTGIIFIDLKYGNFCDLINKFINNFKQLNYTVIYLNDNKNIDIQYDNIRIFVSCIDSVCDVLPKAILTMNNNQLIGGLRKCDIVKRTAEILKEFGISCKHMGYEYIKECVWQGINQHNKPLRLNSDIYPIVAKSYETTIESIEKNIRCAISKAVSLNSALFNERTLGCKITNAFFLTYIMEKIRDEFVID